MMNGQSAAGDVYAKTLGKGLALLSEHPGIMTPEVLTTKQDKASLSK